MNLKEIKKMPFAIFQEKSQVVWKVVVKEPIVAGERLLVVDFLNNRECILSYKRKSSFRIICGKKSGMVKGIDLEGRVKDAILKEFAAHRNDYVLISQKEENRLYRFLGITADTCLNHGIFNLSNWIFQKREEQKQRNRIKRGELMEKDYQLCSEELPEGITEYIRREILSQDKILIYKKGNVIGKCYCCGKDVIAKGERFTQFKRVSCPACGEKVCCIYGDGSNYKVDYVDNIVIAQKGTDGETVFFRQFAIMRDPTAKWMEIKPFLRETVRYGIRGEKTAKWQKEGKETYFMHCERYELEQWTKWRGNQIYDNGYFFCPIGVKEALVGTQMQYADLDGYISESGCRSNVIYFLEYHAKYPVVEFLWKAGYRHVVHQRIFGASKENKNAIYWQGKKLQDCFRFPVRYLKLLPPGQWNLDRIQRMNTIWKTSMGEPKETEMRDILEVEWDPTLVKSAMKYTSFCKIRKYIKKQLEIEQKEPMAENYWFSKNMERNIVCTYRDYLQECEQLHLSMNEKDVLFPKNLEAAHERTAAMVSFEKNKADQEKFQKAVDKLEKFAWEKGTYLIRPARTQEELSKEGSILHHCVGGYIKRMADQETAIFFLRKAEEPDKPYFTLELKNKHVIQCRTEHNRSYESEPEVKDFVDEWMCAVVKKGSNKKGDKVA